MTISQYEILLDKQAKTVRMNAICLSGSGNCDAICDICADSAEQAFRNEIKRQIEQSIRLLRAYGFTVEEN